MVVNQTRQKRRKSDIISNVHTIDNYATGVFISAIKGGLVSESSLVAVYRVNNRAVLFDRR